MFLPPRRFGPVLALAVGLAGCGDPDAISSYKSPKSADGTGRSVPPLAAAPPAPVPGGEVRFLGAQIGIPGQPGQSYFVRLLGPVDRVTAAEKAFDAFLASIKVPGDGGKPISYTAPPGGKEGAARQMRTVTYSLDTPAGPAEMYLSTAIGGELLDNVNRWRTDFVGLDKVTRDQLPAVVTEMTLGAAKAYKVDFRGPGGKGGGMGPMAAPPR